MILGQKNSKSIYLNFQKKQVWKSKVGGPKLGPRGWAPLGIEVEKQGFRTAWLITGQKFPWKNLKSGSSLLTFRDLSSHICQIFMRMARWGDLHFRKSLDFGQSEIFWPTKYEIWSEMGPYGSVGAHIKTGRSPMAHDHFQTPPDPPKGFYNPIWVLFLDVCDRKCLHDLECKHAAETLG